MGKAPPGCFNNSPANLAVPGTSLPVRPPPGCWGTDKSSSTTSTGAIAEKSNEVERTTVMLRNFPPFFTRGMLVELLNSLGFMGKYNFVHLPVDMSRLSCLGFGFVNFRSHSDALQFFKDAHGFRSWQHQSNKVLDVSWSNPLQGLDAQVQRYRNANVMHSSVPDQCRPMLFGEDGEQIPFPCPTVAIRAPRIHSGGW